ncbi:hypothetical protein BKA62DRAFT_775713 [Auriculariales sp. MPI-PUGE-AT-0066]|nr:hypothetical protein BKA62DRAFT_775713 [Auriculariales sp. MPI-PUGE-AT-0066]
MEHGDYNAVLAVIRPIMKTLPVLSNVLEGSVEVVRAISAQVEGQKEQEDLEDLYKHAATVQTQVIISLRYRGGEDQEALLKSVHQFLAVLIEAKIFVVKVTGVKDRSILKKSSRAIAITSLQRRRRVESQIAAGIRTEQRVMAVDQACREIGAYLERQAQERSNADDRIQQALARAQQDRERHALERRKTAERVEASQREAAEQQRETAEEHIVAAQRKYVDDILKPAHTAAHYASNAAEPCVDGTRVQILSTLQEWSASDHGPRIYWLAGLAGTGKTTIASSFCRECQAAGVMVLSFFISRNTPDRNTIAAVVSTLSHQLTQVNLAVLEKVYTALTNQPPILYRKIAAQAKELLVDPLAVLLPTSTATARRIVIVIDAMDECDDFAASDGRDLLRTLVPALCHRGHDVKLFLTSRYEPELRVMLDRVFAGAQDERETFLLHEVQESYVSADIRTFVTKGFADLRERFPSSPSAWPPLYQVNELVEFSGNFLCLLPRFYCGSAKRGRHPFRASPRFWPLHGIRV